MPSSLTSFDVLVAPPRERVLVVALALAISDELPGRGLLDVRLVHAVGRVAGDELDGVFDWVRLPEPGDHGREGGDEGKDEAADGSDGVAVDGTHGEDLWCG